MGGEANLCPQAEFGGGHHYPPRTEGALAAKFPCTAPPDAPSPKVLPHSRPMKRGGGCLLGCGGHHPRAPMVPWGPPPWDAPQKCADTPFFAPQHPRGVRVEGPMVSSSGEGVPSSSPRQQPLLERRGCVRGGSVRLVGDGWGGPGVVRGVMGGIRRGWS